MLERASTRMLPVINRAADAAPMTTACCNACRTCVTTNLLGLIITGASAVGLAVRRSQRESLIPPSSQGERQAEPLQDHCERRLGNLAIRPESSSRRRATRAARRSGRRPCVCLVLSSSAGARCAVVSSNATLFPPLEHSAGRTCIDEKYAPVCRLSALPRQTALATPPATRELLGYGVSSSAEQISGPVPTGQHPARAMKMAFADAVINPEEIDYINAQDTATPLGDASETRVISGRGAE